MKIILSEMEFITLIAESLNKLEFCKGLEVKSVDISSYRKEDYCTIEFEPVKAKEPVSEPL